MNKKEYLERLKEIPIERYYFNGNIEQLENYGDEECQFCGHKIKYQFFIEDKYNELPDYFVGSCCIIKYDINCIIMGKRYDAKKGVMLAYNIFQLGKIIEQIKNHWPKFNDYFIYESIKKDGLLSIKQYNALYDLVIRYEIDTPLFKSFKQGRKRVNIN